ncbi:MAG: hypothetical protein PHS93_07380 [Candidatus Omnitrophica bacterium]|nr:hypothetical protein [Candidatus Omnitrophota bacterium]MDD5352961.1 hypothetical protein [Candidatus Omnitrophota bacterium]MDD5550560.1 hypothetical protein [Candidatus Omnitrophota bacterium]
MIFECPGAKLFKQPQPEIIKCSFCCGEVEIWTDEVKAVCPSCGEILTREQTQSCLDWCKFAKECVGGQLYEKYLNNKHIGQDKVTIEVDNKT